MQLLVNIAWCLSAVIASESRENFQDSRRPGQPKARSAEDQAGGWAEAKLGRSRVGGVGTLEQEGPIADVLIVQLML